MYETIKTLYSRSITFKVVVVLLVGICLIPWVRSIAQDDLPLEKQTYEAQYVQEQIDGKLNPAPKDPAAAEPGPGPEFQYPTGIFDDSESPFSSQDYIITNRWQDYIDNDLVIVYAGSSTSEPDQGLVIFGVLSTDPDKLGYEPILTSSQAGALQVISVNNLRLTLESMNKSAFVFDVISRRFISSIYLPMLAK